MRAVRDVESRRRRITAVLDRAEKVGELAGGDEVQADYARHLCVLMSGFVERSVAEIIQEYAKDKTAGPLRAFIEAQLKRLRNVDKDRLLVVVGSLDLGWRAQLEAFVVDERQAALNSVVGLKNDIAHGGGTGVSLLQVTKYWSAIQEVVDKLEGVLLAGARPLARAHRKTARR